MSTEVIDYAVDSWWEERGRKLVVREIESLSSDRKVLTIFSQLKGRSEDFCEMCVELLSVDVEMAFLTYLVLLISQEAEGVSGET